MIRHTAVLCLLSYIPSQAAAHTGHLIEAAGHDHVAAGVVIGIAIAVGVAGALGRGQRDEEASEADEPEDQELSEA